MSRFTPGELEAARDRVRVFAQYDRDFEEEADVLVVGSGPSGAVVAHEVDRADFKNWMAWCLQNEADKPNYAQFLFSRQKCAFRGHPFTDSDDIRSLNPI